jgi:hypothetical protein
MKISWLSVKVINHSLVTGKQNTIIFHGSFLCNRIGVFFPILFVKTLITYQFSMVTRINGSSLNKFMYRPEFGTMFTFSVVL